LARLVLVEQVAVGLAGKAVAVQQALLILAVEAVEETLV
jgi:hypothetical protein